MTGSAGGTGSVMPNLARTQPLPSRRQYSGAVRPARCRWSQPAGLHQRGSSYPPSARNSW